jgi:hypothetical protein
VADFGYIDWVDGISENLMVRSLILMVCVFGCSASDLRQAQVESTADAAVLMDTGIGAELDGTAEGTFTPVSWTLSGTLDLVNGEIMPNSSHLTVVVMDEMGAPLCRQGVGIVSADMVSVLPDPDVQAWWAVTVGAVDVGACFERGLVVPLSEQLFLGLGEPHPEIKAMLDSDAGDAPSQWSLVKSVFVALGADADVWVFGLATMDGVSQASPMDPVVLGAEIQNGLWKFKAIYSFSF